MITKIFNISRPFHYIIFFLCLVLTYFYNRIYSFGNFSETEIFLETIVFLSYLASIFLVVFIITKNKLTLKNSFSAFYFTLFIFLIPETLQNSNIIIANTFVLLSYRRIFSMRTKLGLEKKYFDSAFWIALAAIFLDLAVLHLIPLALSVFLLKSDRLRHFAIIFLGIISILLLSFLLNIIFQLPITTVEPNFVQFSLDFFYNFNLTTKLATMVMLLIMFWAIASTFFKLVIKSNPNKKTFIILFLFFVTSALISFARGEEWHNTLLLLSFPLSVILANFAQNLRTSWVLDFLLLIAVLIYAATQITYIKWP